MTQQVGIHSAVLKTGSKGDSSLLSVFEYTDYRTYLRDAYEQKRKRNPSFTESAFVRKTGLSSNSRGYFKLVVQGKRNLSATTIRGFSEALELSSKESLYFESLVQFNQASKPRDKSYYFQRLEASAEGRVSKQFELLCSQYNYYSNWYVPAVRELVGLARFQEDATWITSMLRGKITKVQAAEAMVHLERLGMIRRNAETGQWEQSEPLVKYTGNVFSYAVQKFQAEMLARAQESLTEDPYSERRASSITISCDHDRLPEFIQMIDEFRDAVNLKFGVGSKMPDTVFQLGFQVFQLTPIQPLKPSQKQERVK
ncbi:TIGR02147 family protein [Bdellovibrionota bacterium FG-1]